MMVGSAGFAPAIFSALWHTPLFTESNGLATKRVMNASVTLRSVSAISTTTLMLILISGCATVQPSPEKVYIRVPAPCIEASQIPKPPVAKTDADVAKMTDFDLVITLAADRLEYRRYSNEAGAVLVACTR